MRHDAPAALPLAGFVIGLLLAPEPRSAAELVFVAVLLWRFSRGAAVALAFAALGLSMSASDAAIALRDDRFVTVEVPIESDWSPRDHVSMLHASGFVAGGSRVDAPITLFARFEPPVIARQARVRAEGILRFTEGRDAYTMSIKSPQLMSYEGAISSFSPATWNRLLAQRLRRHAVRWPEEIAMIEALVLGRGERLSHETKDNFRRGGTYHLLVFSGLQIALAAAVIAFALRWMGAPRTSDWCLLAFALLAPSFIGATASVSRSSIGIAAYALSRIAKRPTSFENLWCVAALARLIVAPGDLTDPAFHLTYLGAGALIFAGKPFAKTIRWPAYAIAAEIVITPLTLFHFHQFALGGSIATVVMTPIIFMMLIAGAAFCATEMTVLLIVIRFLNRVCVWINDAASPASGFFAAPQSLSVVAALLLVVAAIATVTGKRRALAVTLAMFIPIASALGRHVNARTTSESHAIFLDVGQGDSILLRSGRHNVLVDGGGRAGDERFGENTLLPMLVDRGVRRIDIVMLSHAHPDHCGGLPAVLEQLEVGEVWLNPRRLRGECAQIMLDAIRARRTPVRLVQDRRRVAIGELMIDAFTATRGFRQAPENNSSLVVRVSARGRSLLLTGDIQREAERDLAENIPVVDVLKVPHHGSRSSSTPALLDAARPRIAVISCGRKNWFGHPHETVLNSLQARNIRVYRTDRDGSIDVALDRGIFCRPQFDTPR